MLMTGCSFLLSPTAGEKLIINCFAVLCAILYLLYFANTLPFNRNEVPIIGKLFPLLNSYVHKLHQRFQLCLLFFSHFLQQYYGISGHCHFTQRGLYWHGKRKKIQQSSKVSQKHLCRIFGPATLSRQLCSSGMSDMFSNSRASIF